MFRRLFEWVKLAIVLTFLIRALWAFWLLWPWHHLSINRENYDRIRMGMPVEEVNTILEYGPGDYSVGEEPLSQARYATLLDRQGYTTLESSHVKWASWRTDFTNISLYVADDGKIIGKDFSRDTTPWTWNRQPIRWLKSFLR